CLSFNDPGVHCQQPSTGLGEVLVTINLLNALVWLAINLVNRLRERLVNHRDQQ
ncbi:hypothetical protein ACUODJ_47785, partial [Escherichia sp. HC-CC]